MVGGEWLEYTVYMNEIIKEQNLLMKDKLTKWLQ